MEVVIWQRSADLMITPKPRTIFSLQTFIGSGRVRSIDKLTYGSESEKAWD
jgi:hypothetical protein